jgi:hypothetical protein
MTDHCDLRGQVPVYESGRDLGGIVLGCRCALVCSGARCCRQRRRQINFLTVSSEGSATFRDRHVMTRSWPIRIRAHLVGDSQLLHMLHVVSISVTWRKTGTAHFSPPHTMVHVFIDKRDA